MIRLPSTTYTLQLILSAGTADVDVSYSDATTTGYTGGTQETAATATTQTICAAPAASTVRDIDFLSVKIKTTGGVVTVQKLNSSGAVVTQLISVTLLDEEELNYTHGSGWTAIDANGNRKEVTASIFSGVTVTGLTASQAVFTDSNKALTSNAISGTGSVAMISSGSWTPVPTPVTGTYTTVGAVSGEYTKIGNLIILTFSIAITDKTGGSGGMQVTGWGTTPGAATGNVNGVAYNNSTGAPLVIYKDSSSQFTVYAGSGADPVVNTQVMLGTVIYTV